MVKLIDWQTKLIEFNLIYICKGKGPGSYIGPWDLSKDINRSDDKQIMMEHSQTKFGKKRANV